MINLNLDDEEKKYKVSQNEWQNIPKEWLSNGFTIKTERDEKEDKFTKYFVEWDDSFEELGLKKYICDAPEILYPEYSTTGDPFSDYEKITNDFDSSVLEDARHPMVAAYPSIYCTMPDKIISKYTTVTYTEGDKISASNGIQLTDSSSSSDTNTTSQSMTASIEVSASYGGIIPFGGGINAGFNINNSKESSHSETTKISEGSSSEGSIVNFWNNTLRINEAESAILTGNIRYENFGTAPIYNAHPKLNFVLGSNPKKKTAKTTIITIDARKNVIANTILPNDSYPSKDCNLISWSTGDDFNSHPIKLNLEQLIDIGSGVPLTIETIATGGNYGQSKTVSKGSNRLGEITFKNWSYIMNSINDKTACIILRLNNGKRYERKVAARKIKDFDKQNLPVLTIGEAIELAFKGAKIKTVNGKSIFEFEGNKLVLAENLFIYPNDEFTSNYLTEEKKKHENVFDINLVQGLDLALFETKANNNQSGRFSELISSIKNNSRQFKYDWNHYTNNDENTLVNIKNYLLRRFRVDFSDIIFDIRVTNFKWLNNDSISITLKLVTLDQEAEIIL